MTQVNSKARQFYEQHMESVISHAESIGPEAWIGECEALIEESNNSKTKDLVNLMKVHVAFLVIDKLRALGEL